MPSKRAAPGLCQPFLEAGIWGLGLQPPAQASGPPRAKAGPALWRWSARGFRRPGEPETGLKATSAPLPQPHAWLCPVLSSFCLVWFIKSTAPGDTLCLLSGRRDSATGGTCAHCSSLQVFGFLSACCALPSLEPLSLSGMLSPPAPPSETRRESLGSRRESTFLDGREPSLPQGCVSIIGATPAATRHHRPVATAPPQLTGDGL